MWQITTKYNGLNKYLFYQFLRARHLTYSRLGFVIGSSQNIGWGWSQLNDILPRILTHITISNRLSSDWLLAGDLTFPFGGSFHSTTWDSSQHWQLASPVAFILSGANNGCQEGENWFLRWRAENLQILQWFVASWRIMIHKQMYSMFVPLKFYWRTIRKIMSRRLLRYRVKKVEKQCHRVSLLRRLLQYNSNKIIKKYYFFLSTEV